MNWWDKVTDTASNAFDTSLDGASGWFGNRVADYSSDPKPAQASATTGAVPVNVSDSTGGGMLQNINWPMVGGIVAVLGLLLAFTRGK